MMDLEAERCGAEEGPRGADAPLLSTLALVFAEHSLSSPPHTQRTADSYEQLGLSDRLVPHVVRLADFVRERPRMS